MNRASNSRIEVPTDLLNRILALFPAFAEVWDDPDNVSRDDDGTFSFHGAFAEFSHFTRDNFASFTPQDWSNIGDLMLECMDGQSSLDNAAATCYLENVQGEPFSRTLASNLTGRPLQFFSQFLY